MCVLSSPSTKFIYEHADNIASVRFPVDFRQKKYFWHGAKSTGSVSVGEYCQAWTNESSRELGSTSSLHSQQLLSQSTHTCDSQLAVLCIETNALSTDSS